jgi:hypothetical protein
VTNVLQEWPDMVQTNVTSGFQVLSYEHSGEFNRNIQEPPTWPFYSQLKTTFSHNHESNLPAATFRSDWRDSRARGEFP